MENNNEWHIDAARDAVGAVKALAEAFAPLAEISRTLHSFLGQDCHPLTHIDTLGKFHAETIGGLIGDGVGSAIDDASNRLKDSTESAAEEVKEGLESIAQSISGAGEEVASAILELAKAVQRKQ